MSMAMWLFTWPNTIMAARRPVEVVVFDDSILRAPPREEKKKKKAVSAEAAEDGGRSGGAPIVTADMLAEVEKFSTWTGTDDAV